MLLHIGAMRLHQDGYGHTPWQALGPQTRLLCALMFVFATALTPPGQWGVWGLYGVGLASLIALSRVSLMVLLQRVAVEMALVGVVLVGTLFRQEGTVLWHWGIVQVTTVGLTVLASVGLKTLLCLGMINLLVLTTPVSALLQGLTQLKMPPLLVAILAAMHRYTAVLVEEFAAMRRAALARNLMARRRGQRRVVGHMMGALFLRSYDRGDRVYQAMVARGYQGTLTAAPASALTRLDSLALGATAGWLGIGQLIQHCWLA
ncbi:MAG: cobalt ECF transporter T component CbiQ [Cyanobacteria bacterium REEB459]|nr:cobalt ECF transporter T component CbiQ [Cyanobacteria bacterium REEB459]